MKTTPAWAQALQISKASIDEWLTVAPIEESFTFWCLFTGRLPLNHYFAWAKDHYSLAFLEAGYFQQTPNFELWKQIHSVANWSPWMLPIEQWDGNVFIACVEPPTEMQWSFPVCFVLADPNLLEHLWQSLQATTDSKATATTPIAPPPQTVTAITIAKIPEAANLKPTAPPPPPSPKLAETDIPLGLKKADAPPNDGSPAGLNLSGLNLSHQSMPPPIPLKIDLSTIDSPVPIKIDMSTAPPPAFAIKLDMPEAAVPSIPGGPTAKKTAANPGHPKSQTPVEISNFIAGPIALSQAPAEIEAAKSDDECIAWFFKQMRTRYNSGLVLLYNKNSLQPWKWESTITTKSTSGVVTFDTPSLFRIAARTLRPYHGYVVDNPLHQDFFQSWGFAKLPVHVTGIPIVLGGAFRGLFVCMANEPMTTESLEFIEKTADKTVVQMEKLGTTFQKSA